MKILLTGFTPFGGETVNPSWELLQQRFSNEKDIAIVRIPTSYRGSMEALEEALLREKPDLALCLGQAGGRACITLEKVGINWMQASLADNDGVLMTGQKIEPDGPDAYFSTFPIQALLDAAGKAAVPVAQSLSAGTFICNRAFYGVGHFAATHSFPRQYGFMHIPYLPEQVLDKPQQPSMDMDTLEKGLRAVLEALKGQF